MKSFRVLTLLLVMLAFTFSHLAFAQEDATKPLKEVASVPAPADSAANEGTDEDALYSNTDEDENLDAVDDELAEEDTYDADEEEFEEEVPAADALTVPSADKALSSEKAIQY